MSAHYVDTRGAESDARIIPPSIKVFDLAGETLSIASAHDPGRTARTLVRNDTLRLTLMRLNAGARVMQHRTDHELTIHTVSGHVSIHTSEQRFELNQGHVACLAGGIAHDIEAREESAILLTVGVSHRQRDRPMALDNPPAED